MANPSNESTAHRTQIALEEEIETLSEHEQQQAIVDSKRNPHQYHRSSDIRRIADVHFPVDVFSHSSISGDPFISTIQSGKYKPSMIELLNSRSLRKRITSDLHGLGLNYKLLVKIQTADWRRCVLSVLGRPVQPKTNTTLIG